LGASATDRGGSISLNLLLTFCGTKRVNYTSVLCQVSSLTYLFMQL
jgi:hypothetical protein